VERTQAKRVAPCETINLSRVNEKEAPIKKTGKTLRFKL
jgi:hypothetical protein